MLGGRMQAGMLCFFALAFGLADAFYYPAQGAIGPQVLPAEQLQAGNMLVRGAIKAGRTSPGKMISASLSSPAAAESPSKKATEPVNPGHHPRRLS